MPAGPREPAGVSFAVKLQRLAANRGTRLHLDDRGATMGMIQVPAFQKIIL